MIALSKPGPTDRFCDPMCGTGTILAERMLAGPYQSLLGGDNDPAALAAAKANLAQAWSDASRSGGPDRRAACVLYLWDARLLPIRAGMVDAIVCNLPFGEQIGSHADNPALYDRFFAQVVRVLSPGGRAVLLTSEKDLVHRCTRSYPHLRREQEILVGVLGQAARIYVLRRT
jgi:23S rRNA G2445 N2-methylase RlmL